MISNYGSTLNSHINFLLNRGTHTYSSSVWKKTKTNQIFDKVTKLFELKSDFVKILKGNKENVNIPKNKTTKPIIDQFFNEYKFISFHLLTNRLTNLISMPKKKMPSSFLQPNARCAHLFSQIHTFKTERNIKKDGYGNKPKDFFRFGILQSNSKAEIKHDLNSFCNNLSKEKLTPGQNQRALLAYVEGYVIGKDSASKENPKLYGIYLLRLSLTVGMWYLYLLWLTHVFNWSVLIGMLYGFYKNGKISFGPMSDLDRTELTEIKLNVKFSDVKGADEAKQELKNVVEFLNNPETFSDLGGKLPKGVLLVGPPGTGKTLLAKAVAGEAGVPFYSKSGPEFDEIYVGIGARRIRELFKLAKENVPCVVFIDEIDSIGKERTSSPQHPHANDTINQLLTEMDGFRSNSGIIVLGATNRKADLDRALLRPGRFDVEVNVSIPDYGGRKELFDHYLSKISHQDVNVEKLARGTTNFTGADIENMVNQAALRAAIMGAKYVTTDHLEYARDKALMGPERISRILDEETNKITAYHEGGHTVVAYFTEHAQPLHKVTIIARGSSLGHTSYIPDKDTYHVTKTQLLAMIDTLMGGRAAEELIFGPGKITSGASSDLQKATDLASQMVKKWGMSDEVGLTTYNNQTLMSPQTANLIDMEVKKILNDSYERAKGILMKHQDKHRDLSEALIKYETLDAEAINMIMNGKPFR